MPRSLLGSFRKLFVFLLAIGVVAPVAASADSDKRRSLTGVWITKPASRFVLQDVGGPVRESTLMRWELEEDEDGLITGYNSYFSEDDAGESRSRGTLCMVGARIGNRVVLEEAYAVLDGEPVPNLSSIPIFVFDCQTGGRKKLRCLGHGLSNIQPNGLKATLVRSRRAGERFPVPEAARQICQPETAGSLGLE
ncbi:MAG: hypothetical protein VX546_15255 [Myxococcota bacterium]|nr:hypothetical protein [Myxococcota bacterium]